MTHDTRSGRAGSPVAAEKTVPEKTVPEKTVPGNAERGNAAPDRAAPENTVLLRGRVSTGSEQRELPSGTIIVTFRVTVARAATVMTKGSRQSVDWVDCVAWGAGPRRTVGSWVAGDEVEVAGALRRRFYRGGQGTSTRLEVEVLRAKRLSRHRPD